MQKLQYAQKIEDEDKKSCLLEVVSDKYTRSILDAIMDKPKTCLEVSRECRIPISTVYRRMQFLHDNKLVTPSGSFNEDGKKYFMYKSKVKEIRTNFLGGSGSVQIKMVLNISD